MFRRLKTSTRHATIRTYGSQTSPTNASAPAAGISENPNPASKVQDDRALAQKAEQIRTTCVNGRHRVCGQVIQVTPGGLVVESGYTDLLRPELSSAWVAAGTVSARPTKSRRK